MDALYEHTQPCAFAGVAFPVESADTDGGHDGAEHTAINRAGADCEPTGRKPYKGRLRVPLVNGLDGWPDDLFPTRYRELVEAFEANPIGELRHPTRGNFTAFLHDWHEKLAPDTRSGVVIEVEWTEHSESIGWLMSFGEAAPGSVAEASTLAETADAAMAAKDPDNDGEWVSIKDTFDATLGGLDLTEVTSYLLLAQAFTDLLGAIGDDLALGGFAAANAHDVIAALEACRAAVLRLRAEYLPDEPLARFWTVPAEMPLWQCSLHVYGTTAGVARLRSCNPLDDPALVPAGTVLMVLPLR
jgi:prophage DNA circulation protein